MKIAKFNEIEYLGVVNMRHYVLLKFKPGCFNDELFNYIKNTFDDIDKLDDIKVVKVHKNCVERDSNMDIMIEMEVRDEKALKMYLNHELHISFANRINDYLLSKASFDSE